VHAKLEPKNGATTECQSSPPIPFIGPTRSIIHAPTAHLSRFIVVKAEENVPSLETEYEYVAGSADSNEHFFRNSKKVFHLFLRTSVLNSPLYSCM